MPPAKDAIENQEHLKEDKKALAELKRRKEAGERVGRLVMQKLGTPHRFCRVDGHFLYKNRFRVNVWAHTDNDCGGEEKHIIYSYFVMLGMDEKSEEDRIIKSIPEIKEIKNE